MSKLIQFIDSHCHIHDMAYFAENLHDTITEAEAVGVSDMICIGTTVKDSRAAIELAGKYDQVHAVVGIHPHEAKSESAEDLRELITNALAANDNAVIGIGEIGLDYYYENSARRLQQERLQEQLVIAAEFDLPLSFHIRGSKDDPGDAFDDFVKICDTHHTKYGIIRGVVHSFTARKRELAIALELGLYLGVNGIMTFTKDQEQLDALAAIPLGSMLLETDAPFLTPKPFRGKINTPKQIPTIAQFIADFTKTDLEKIAAQTTKNTKDLFGI